MPRKPAGKPAKAKVQRSKAKAAKPAESAGQTEPRQAIDAAAGREAGVDIAERERHAEEKAERHEEKVEAEMAEIAVDSIFPEHRRKSEEDRLRRNARLH